jgi:hypothetical protein
VIEMDQCSVLFVTPLYVKSRSPEETQARALRSLGFHVDECDDFPANEAFAPYHAVIVRPSVDCDLPMLAARLRAKPRFGRRVLIALVPEAMATRDVRGAMLSGFDYMLPDTCGARDLAATILRLLRPYPEYRCMLRHPGGRRKAA